MTMSRIRDRTLRDFFSPKFHDSVMPSASRPLTSAGQLCYWKYLAARSGSAATAWLQDCRASSSLPAALKA